MLNLGSFLPLEKVLQLVRKALEDFFKRKIDNYKLIVNIIERKVDFEVDGKLFKFAEGEKFISACEVLMKKEIKSGAKIDVFLVHYREGEKTMLEIYYTDKDNLKEKITKLL
jgi:hypothetical protein